MSHSFVREFLYQEVFAFTVFKCVETVASWQHCIDYNTISARLSKLGATTAAQVSGGQIPSSEK